MKYKSIDIVPKEPLIESTQISYRDAMAMNGVGMPNLQRMYCGWQLALALLRAPNYQMLLCADSVLPPSPWTDKFSVEVDHEHRVIRLNGDLT